MKIYKVIFIILLLVALSAQSFLIPTLEANDKSIKQINVTELSQFLTIYDVPAITDEKILPSSSISTSYISNTISVTASPGEFEPASFVIQPKMDIKSLKLTATNLTGQNGSISSSNIDIRVVKCWYQAGLDVGDTQNKTLTPELLLKDDSLVKIKGNDNYIKLNGRYVKISDPNGIQGVPVTPTTDQFPVEDAETLQPIDLHKSENKQFWITIKVPNKAKPGSYTGKIFLKPLIGPIAEIELDVNVLPISLRQPYLIYGLDYRGSLENGTVPTISSDYKNEEQFRAEMKDLFDHGVENPTVFYQDSLEKVLQIRNETGMNNKTLYYLGIEITDYGNDLTALKKAVIDLKNLARPYGITEVYIYGKDEESLDNSENRAQINTVHKAGGKVMNAQSSLLADQVVDALDLAEVPNDLDIKLAERYHGYHHKIVNYNNPQAGVEQPETYRRNYGLLLWQNNYDGAIDYAYQANYSNIWDDFDDAESEYRDHVFAYPTVNGVIDTIEWEGWREGVDDIRYLTTLLESIKKAKSEGKDTSNVEKWIVDLKNSNLTEQDLGAIRTTMVKYILSLNDLYPERI